MTDRDHDEDVMKKPRLGPMNFPRLTQTSTDTYRDCVEKQMESYKDFLSTWPLLDSDSEDFNDEFPISYLELLHSPQRMKTAIQKFNTAFRIWNKRRSETIKVIYHLDFNELRELQSNIGSTEFVAGAAKVSGIAGLALAPFCYLVSLAFGIPAIIGAGAVTMTRTVQYQTKKVKLEPFQEAYEADCNECLNLKQKIEELGQLSKQLAKLTTTAENDRLGTLLLKINKMKHQKTSIKDGTLLEGTGTIEMLILNDPVAKKSDSDFASTALAIALSGPDPALKMGTSSTSMISRSTNQKALFIEQVLQLITDEQNIMQDLYKKINGPLDDYPVEDILSLSKRHGQKQLRESVTTSSPTAETNRVEDLPSLTDIWKTFIKTSKGKKPSCLQRLSKCDGLNKILIDTTDEDNPELKTFLAKTNYENHKSYFLIHVVRPSAPFRYAGKGQANHIVRSHITLGGPIFSAHAAKRVPDTFDSIFKPQVADNIGNDSVWSLGLLVKDVDTEAVYLATCAHGAWKSLEQPIPLKFYSAISRCHEVNFPISCTDYHAHYGRLDEKEDVSPLIDMLLLQLPNSFLNSKDVNLVLSKDDKPMDMSIYSGNMKEFLNAEVYMHGSVSGFRKGRLIDAIDENNILMLSKLEFETWGGFMVVSDESCEASSGQNFANYGDSAALVYTKHPQVADTWLALGQVWGEAARNHIANSGVSYEHVTYCTSLKYAQQYARKTFGINMTYHAHSKIVNHVQEIGHLEIAMQDAVNGALRLGRRARVAPVR